MSACMQFFTHQYPMILSAVYVGFHRLRSRLSMAPVHQSSYDLIHRSIYNLIHRSEVSVKSRSITQDMKYHSGLSSLLFVRRRSTHSFEGPDSTPEQMLMLAAYPRNRLESLCAIDINSSPSVVRLSSIICTIGPACR